MGQTDIGFETGKKLWYIESFTNNRQFLGVQLVNDSNIKLNDVIVDTYAWKHEKYANASQGRLRFFDDRCTIEKQGSIADSILVEGDSDFVFTQLPHGDIEVKFNLADMDWTITIDGVDYVTQNFAGKVTGGLLNDRKRFVIEQPRTVMYSKQITIINSNLGVM
jgi:hypothetical protein